MLPERPSRSIDCTASRTWSFSRIRTSSSTTARFTLVSVVVNTSDTIDRIAIATRSSPRVLPAAFRSRGVVARIVAISGLGRRWRLVDAVGEQVSWIERREQVDLVHAVDDVLVPDRDPHRRPGRLPAPPG